MMGSAVHLPRGRLRAGHHRHPPDHGSPGAGHPIPATGSGPAVHLRQERGPCLRPGDRPEFGGLIRRPAVPDAPRSNSAVKGDALSARLLLVSIRGAASGTAVAAGPWKHRRGPAVLEPFSGRRTSKPAASGYRSFGRERFGQNPHFQHRPSSRHGRRAGVFPESGCLAQCKFIHPRIFRASEGGAIPPDSETRQKGHPKRCPF